MNLSRLKWPLTGVVALVIIAGSWWLGQGTNVPTPTAISLLTVIEPTATLAPQPTISPTAQATATPPMVAVYVSGAVKKPGVYRLSDGARVDDAVRAAGGLASDADAVRVNLAARVRDEQQIYVPTMGEIVAPVAPLSGGNEPANTVAATPTVGDGKVNINTASVAEFEPLPRIGPAIAQRIIDYRTANGPFATIEDLQNVKGIGPATFADLKDKISVE